MRLGRGFTAVAQQVPRLAGLAGRCPAPHTAPVGRGAARGTCGLSAKLPPLGDRPRGSRVWYGSLPVGKLIPLFGNGPHGSLKKASVDLKSRWPFVLQKYLSYIETSQPTRGKPAPCQRGKRKSARLSALQKCPSHTEASQPARGKPARRRLRGSRAAIGSGGKKPCPF